MSPVGVISHGAQRCTQKILDIIGQSIRLRYVQSTGEFAPCEVIVPSELAVGRAVWQAGHSEGSGDAQWRHCTEGPCQLQLLVQRGPESHDKLTAEQGQDLVF